MSHSDFDYSFVREAGLVADAVRHYGVDLVQHLPEMKNRTDVSHLLKCVSASEKSKSSILTCLFDSWDDLSIAFWKVCENDSVFWRLQRVVVVYRHDFSSSEMDLKHSFEVDPYSYIGVPAPLAHDFADKMNAWSLERKSSSVMSGEVDFNSAFDLFNKAVESGEI